MNGESFEAFFRTQHPRLVSLALTFTADSDAARDMAQESLVRAYRSWASVSTMDQPGAWVRRVLVNLAIDASRRHHREAHAHDRLRLADQAPEVDMAAAHSPFWASVRDLPDLQRSVVALHYVDDMSVADCARVLQISEGSVKTSLHRARATLARTLEVTHE